MAEAGNIIPLGFPVPMSGKNAVGEDWFGTAIAISPRGAHMSYLIAVPDGPPQWFAQEHVDSAYVKTSP